jgi:hypothetical protein
MSAFWWTTLFLSVDSFVMAAALSPLIRSPASRWCLASLFGLCDGLAVLVGSALSSTNLSLHLSERAVPCIAVVYGLYYLIAAQWDRFCKHPRLVWLLPPLMSLDNLAYGAGVQTVAGGALVLAVASLTLAALGFYLGSLVRFASERAREMAAGVGLLTAGLILSLV